MPSRSHTTPPTAAWPVAGSGLARFTVLTAMLMALVWSPVTAVPTQVSVPVLMYHHVGDWGPAGDWAPWVVKPVDFEAQLDWLRRHGYHAITMSQFQAHRERGEPLPARPVMITFDDGWAEHLWIARQFLEPRGMPAVFFVYTGAIGAPGSLRWEDVKGLEAMGHEVLSHTVSHPSLPGLTDERLRAEMRDSRAVLERELGHPVECIAYPFGDFDGRVVRAASDAGYRLAFAAAGPNATTAMHALRLPRWNMRYGEPLAAFVRQLRAR